MTRCRPGAAAGALVALALVLALVVAAPAPNAVAQPQGSTGTIALTSQTAFRAPDQPFSLSVQVRSSAAPGTLEIAVSTFRRLTSRSQFQQSLEGRFPTKTPIEVAPPVPLDSLTADPAGNVTVTITPPATRDGVYPMRVDLRDRETKDVVDSFTTFLVTVPAVVESDPLDVAVLVPFHAPPATQPNGKYALDPRRAAGLGELTAAIGRHQAVPLTVIPTGETLDALAASSDASSKETLAALARDAAASQIVGSTYVPTDLRSLIDSGLAGEVATQLERGRAAIKTRLGASPPTDLRAIDERLGAETLDQLEAEGVKRLVVPEALLDPVTLRITLTGTVRIAGASDVFTAAVADTALAAHASREASPALAAHDLIADLAMLWGDEPGQAPKRRGAVVALPRSWEPSGVFLDELLSGLTDNPILAPVTLDRFFGEVGEATARNRPLVRTFLQPEGSSGIAAPAVRSARRKLEAFASIVDADNPVLASLDRTLLTAESNELRARQRAAYLKGVTDQIDRQLRGVSMPEHRSITLTAREGSLPITVRSDLNYPVRVVLSVESETLAFRNGTSREVELTRDNTTERFQVRARGSGSFPVRVRVTSPQGGIVLSESRFTVRSTAVSGVGVGLSVGAIVFLLVWWASHLRSRRAAARQARQAVAPA